MNLAALSIAVNAPTWLLSGAHAAAAGLTGAAQGAEEPDLAAMAGDVIPEIVLVVGGIAVLFYALFAPRRLQTIAAALALVTVAVATAISVAMLAGDEYLTFTDTYARDDVAVWSKLIVLLATAGTIGLSVTWFQRDAREGEYYTLLLFSALGAILLAGATDLKEFVVAMLLSSVTGFVLTAYHRRSALAGEAGIKYFLLGAFTSASMLIGTAYLYGLAGSTTLPGLSQGLPGGGIALVAGSTLVVVALAFKVGAVPAHAWMPDVAQGAPAPVAAFVTTAPKVGGLVFLARLVVAYPSDSLDWAAAVAVISAATMTLGNLAALWQDDVRRLLGWSAVSQTGYGLMAVVALGRSDLAIPALMYFLLAYVLGNLAAFGVVVELRGLTELSAYSGLARAHAWLMNALTLAFLSFIGIPPLAGFFAKLVLFAAAIEAGYTWLAVLAIVNTVVSIAYYARVMAPAYFGDLRAPVPVLGHWELWTTLSFAAALIVVGIFTEPFLDAFAAAGLLPR
jgi:NADH-quinone oxidoreductase subunit N